MWISFTSTFSCDFVYYSEDPPLATFSCFVDTSELKTDFPLTLPLIIQIYWHFECLATRHIFQSFNHSQGFLLWVMSNFSVFLLKYRCLAETALLSDLFFFQFCLVCLFFYTQSVYWYHTYGHDLRSTCSEPQPIFQNLCGFPHTNLTILRFFYAEILLLLAHRKIHIGYFCSPL